MNSYKTQQSRIDEGVKNYQNTEGAVLLDVRRPDEYEQGHIENAVNIELDNIESIVTVYPDLDTPLFVYCRSGVRSASATGKLKEMGYTNVYDIGGILDYTGNIVK